MFYMDRLTVNVRADIFIRLQIFLLVTYTDGPLYIADLLACAISVFQRNNICHSIVRLWYASPNIMWTKEIAFSPIPEKNMPQLVPFYFVNQVTFVFGLILVLLYVFSKYILPKFVSLFSTRFFITKL